MIKHKKISGLANTAEALVGGDDWDDDHVYGLNSVFVLGRVEFSYDPGSDAITGLIEHGPVATSCSVDGAYFVGSFTLPAVAPGCHIVLSVDPKIAPIPATWQVRGGSSGLGAYFVYASASHLGVEAEIPDPALVTITVMAAVVED